MIAPNGKFAVNAAKEKLLQKNSLVKIKLAKMVFILFAKTVEAMPTKKKLTKRKGYIMPEQFYCEKCNKTMAES